MPETTADAVGVAEGVTAGVVGATVAGAVATVEEQPAMRSAALRVRNAAVVRGS